MFEKIFEKYNSPLELCKLCLHSRIIRKHGFRCNLTNEIPKFYVYCHNFKLSKNNNNNTLKHSKTPVGYYIIVTIFSIVSLIAANIDTTIIIAICAIISLGSSIYLYKIPSVVQKTNWTTYLYLLSMNYIMENKSNINNSEINIIKQQIIKFFGKKTITFANQIFNSDKNYSYELEKYSEKITTQEKIIILSLCSQVFAYNNLIEYKNKKNILHNLSKHIKLPIKIYEKIYDHFKNIETEQNKKQKTKSKKYSNNLLKYYATLTIPINASKYQIKKKFKQLALKYHPDKFVKSPPHERQQANEKFKEISEAYNFIKKIRKI